MLGTRIPGPVQERKIQQTRSLPSGSSEFSKAGGSLKRRSKHSVICDLQADVFEAELPTSLDICTQEVWVGPKDLHLCKPPGASPVQSQWWRVWRSLGLCSFSGTPHETHQHIGLSLPLMCMFRVQPCHNTCMTATLVWAKLSFQWDFCKRPPACLLDSGLAPSAVCSVRGSQRDSYGMEGGLSIRAPEQGTFQCLPISRREKPMQLSRVFRKQNAPRSFS